MSPDRKLDVNGGAIIRSSFTVASGTSVSYAAVIGSGTALTQALVVVSTSGNVGIGTTNPLNKLVVLNGNIQISTTTGNRGIVFQDGTTQLTANGNNSWSTNGNNVYNTNSGNVGIGTALPDRKLDVDGGAVVRSSMVVTGTGLSGTQTVFQVAGSTMVALCNGNVGIGEANPTAKLYVVGTSTFTSDLYCGTTVQANTINYDIKTVKDKNNNKDFVREFYGKELVTMPVSGTTTNYVKLSGITEIKTCEASCEGMMAMLSWYEVFTTSAAFYNRDTEYDAKWHWKILAK